MISVVDIGFPGFYGVFVSSTSLESFEARKVFQMISFGGGGGLRFALPCIPKATHPNRGSLCK